MVSYLISVKILYVKHLVQRLIHGKHSSNVGYYTVIKLIKINPEYSLEGLMLKLKLQYFDHLMQRADSLGKTVMLGKIEGKRRKGQQRMRWLDSITDSTDMNLSKLWEVGEERESLVCCSPQGRKKLDMTKRLNNNIYHYNTQEQTF